jgi:5'-nucleotidase
MRLLKCLFFCVLLFRKHKFGEQYLPSCVVDDVYAAIEDVHESGDLQRAIVQDLPRFVAPSPALPGLLRSLSAAGKKFFLCTNSGFEYSNRTLSHLLDLPYCPSGRGWRDMFDLVVCSAQKPSFYCDERPFREWDVARACASARPVARPCRGQVYVQGSASALTQCSGWRGKDILYLGDNLQNDLQQARRWHGWHTGTD